MPCIARASCATPSNEGLSLTAATCQTLGFPPSIEVVAGVEGSAREVLEAYINHTLIGADELCHTLAFNNDEEEAEVDDAFAKLEANFFTANA